jgi:hypothetical protein
MTQPPTPDYSSRRTEPKKAIGDLGAPQAVFDTVGGPNLRLRDNLIQLGTIGVAVPVAFLIALLVTRDVAMSVGIGLLGGLIGGILISGAALGIYRGIHGVKKMGKK